MSILDEAIREEPEKVMSEDPGIEELEQLRPALPHIDLSFLKAATGDGSIEEYEDHVLNPEHSRGLAQVLRGFTGLAGELNLAIIDIALGVFRMVKETKSKEPMNEPLIKP